MGNYMHTLTHYNGVILWLRPESVCVTNAIFFREEERRERTNSMEEQTGRKIKLRVYIKQDN